MIVHSGCQCLCNILRKRIGRQGDYHNIRGLGMMTGTYFAAQPSMTGICKSIGWQSRFPVLNPENAGIASPLTAPSTVKPASPRIVCAISIFSSLSSASNRRLPAAPSGFPGYSHRGCPAGLRMGRILTEVRSCSNNFKWRVTVKRLPLPGSLPPVYYPAWL